MAATVAFSPPLVCALAGGRHEARRPCSLVLVLRGVPGRTGRRFEAPLATAVGLRTRTISGGVFHSPVPQAKALIRRIDTIDAAPGRLADHTAASASCPDCGDSSTRPPAKR